MRVSKSQRNCLVGKGREKERKVREDLVKFNNKITQCNTVIGKWRRTMIFHESFV